MGSIEDYISEMRRKGYDIYSIRSSLLNSGYPQQQVDAAISSVSSVQQKQPSKVLLISIIFVSVFLVIGVSYYFLFLAQPHIEQPAPVPTTPTIPGSPAAPTTPSTPSTPPTPSTPTTPSTPKPSTTLAVTPGCSNGIQDNGEKGIDCEGPCAKVCEFQLNPEFPIKYPVFTPPQDSGDSGYAKLEKIKLLAKDNPEKAASECSSLQEVLRDECYINIAEISKKNGYCDFVLTPTSRDTCYVNLVLVGDYSVCDKISDATVKDACIELKNKNK